jgi:hypothetical protein
MRFQLHTLLAVGRLQSTERICEQAPLHCHPGIGKTIHHLTSHDTHCIRPAPEHGDWTHRLYRLMGSRIRHGRGISVWNGRALEVLQGGKKLS